MSCHAGPASPIPWLLPEHILELRGGWERGSCLAHPGVAESGRGGIQREWGEGDTLRVWKKFMEPQDSLAWKRPLKGS